MRRAGVLVGVLIAAMSIAKLAYAEEAQSAAAPEEKPHPQSPFAEIDTNGDGKIDYNEFLAAHEKKIEMRFKALDTNGDGFLTQDETMAAKERHQSASKQ